MNPYAYYKRVLLACEEDDSGILEKYHESGILYNVLYEHTDECVLKACEQRSYDVLMFLFSDLNGPKLNIFSLSDHRKIVDVVLRNGNIYIIRLFFSVMKAMHADDLREDNYSALYISNADVAKFLFDKQHGPFLRVNDMLQRGVLSTCVRIDAELIHYLFDPKGLNLDVSTLSQRDAEWLFNVTVNDLPERTLHFLFIDNEGPSFSLEAFSEALTRNVSEIMRTERTVALEFAFSHKVLDESSARELVNHYSCYPYVCMRDSQNPAIVILKAAFE